MSEHPAGAALPEGASPAAGRPGPAPGGRFADNIVYFARVLRDAGLPVGPAAVIDAIAAVEVAGLASRQDLYWTLHAVFVSKREHHAVYDEAFRIYWRNRQLVEKLIAMLSPLARPEKSPDKPKAGAARVNKALSSGNEPVREVERPEVEIDARFTVSDREILRNKDFAQMSAAEIAAAKAELARLMLPEDRMRLRRLKPKASGRLIDPRATFRATLRAGGEIIRLEHRDRREMHPPIVALLDISGSMSQYSRVFLHFLHALTERRRRVTTFLFGTRLTNVTRQLRMKDPDEALDATSEFVADWAGGTRIATAISTFNRVWSRRVMGQGPIVLLITDGLERDSDEDLAQAMDRLNRSCRRLIWLNPLLRFDGFEAKARGIRIMLPHVDEFRSVHNLDSIAALCRAISGGERRERM
ncbi:MAG: VWA domain-containing protein, partial [Ancalomicrobiaceae bacterium]|nr:VWA domain-containing protein [Ancalomicrobiaceae bacterium]